MKDESGVNEAKGAELGTAVRELYSRTSPICTSQGRGGISPRRPILVKLGMNIS
jgi:hypothetical protein